MPPVHRTVLVTGATGFVGSALVPALAAAGHRVRATSRRRRAGPGGTVEWMAVDVRRPADLERALEGVDAAYFLVHGMAAGRGDYVEEERRTAAGFARAAERAGTGRIVYLGGVAPQGTPSRHLASRLAVGEVLRAGRVPALELRASMIVGAGSASWQVVRDLAMRLPVMLLPAWARSRTCPVWIGDVVGALVAGLELPLQASAVHDVPGPDVLAVREILERVAALRGRRLPAARVPLPVPRVSMLWLKLISGADWRVVRELVQGLATDLLPRDACFWELAGLPAPLAFDEAARRALAGEAAGEGLRGALAAVEEALVDRCAPRLGPVSPGERRSR
ncbi:NAD-dependent epimerase/dehydratase [Anaeromyxobacter sp. K]|uniref:NAD-dependent epimerase/dehydratase family protein n=1 Tax=Anaeromyxobacter sp. (strain K) TaxID=447217 RepID=UPI00015F87EC|nr:NAD-dependent epimerase/dehydratase family protein [Anaeromyxobacter sp. K]ACG74345.1 NAD-dependent epimerase/dehydratase [Anaeromyxobacter sp. K]